MERSLCVIYISVNFENIWYRLLAIELKVNVLVINRFLLNDICFLYPNKQSTFRLCNSLFYTTSFDWFYWLKSFWITTIEIKDSTEFVASILQLHLLYIYLLLTLKEILPPQPSSFYFIVILKLNRWNIWLKIVVENKVMFTVYSVQFVLIKKHMSITQYLGTLKRLFEERKNIREHELLLWTLWNAISSSYCGEQINC